MKVEIISIGKKHDLALIEYIADFEKRIRADCELTWTILASQDDKNKEVQIKKESENILKILVKEPQDSFLILLDEKGKEKSTVELAELFQEKMSTGTSKIIFIIGGAFGVAEEVKAKANLILSLSKLVFPHQLVRVILVEQIYRCISILKNGKYHHE